MGFEKIGKFMEQAKKMQEQLKQNQEALSKQTVVGSAGGGIITIEKTCRYETLRVTLDPAFSSEEREIQQDLIKAAMNDADRKVEETLQNSMSQLASQFSLPEDLLGKG